MTSYVVEHAGLAGENTGWNTGAFTIETSVDGATWTNRVTVSGNRTSRTYHPVAASTGGETADWNTRDFDLQISTNGTTWATVASPRGNTAGVTQHAVGAWTRYVRLNVITATQTTDSATRIYEVEVYA